MFLLRLLADENIPKVLMRELLRRNINVLWLTKTEHKGIKDKEVINLANTMSRTILTRDSDFMKGRLASKATYGVVYLAETVTKENINILAEAIERVVKNISFKKGLVVIVRTSYVEIIYP